MMLRMMAILIVLNAAFGGIALVELLRIRELKEEISEFKKSQVLRFRETMEDAWGDEAEGGHWMEEWCADCENIWGLLEEFGGCVACCCAKDPDKAPPGFVRREACFDQIREMQDS